MNSTSGAALPATTAAPEVAHPFDAETFALEYRRARSGTARESRWVAIGWKLGLVIDVGLLSLPVPAVIVIPPLLECRHTALHIGFFAGDSFENCAKRRIAARWTHLDARVKMIVRGSGR